MKTFEIEFKSEIISATLFESKLNNTILIIASATGVRQEFYQKFAKYIQEKGITVVTFDYYGIGRSLRKPIKEVNCNAADWGQNNLECILQFANSNYPEAKKIVLGHSIGGQLLGLAETSEKIDKIILVAAQSGYWKHWRGIGRIKMWFNWYILFPLILKLFGYLNSKKISGMENLPRNVADQWSKWGRYDNYILSDKSITQTYYKKIKVDLTEISILDDKFATLESVKWMSELYENANKKSIRLKPVDFGVDKIGHFGLFKEKFRSSIWPKILNEIN